MFWGCMSKRATGSLVALEGYLNSEKYMNLLQSHLVPEFEAQESYGETYRPGN